MKKTKQRILSGLFPVLVALSINAQDIHFTQFHEAPLTLNPALAGNFLNKYRFCLNYKNQWPMAGKGYNTVNASFDMPMFRDPNAGSKKVSYMGAGLNLYKDMAGEANFGAFHGSFNISGVVPIAVHHQLSVGLAAGVSQRNANINNLQWGSQFQNGAYDPSINGEPDRLSTAAYPDYSLGFNYEFNTDEETFQGFSSKKFNVGYAIIHYNKPKIGVGNFISDVVYRKKVLHFNGSFDIGGGLRALQPSVAYIRQGPSKELIVGFIIRNRKETEGKFTNLVVPASISYGVYFRVGDAIAPTIIYSKGNWQIGLSYDINYSSNIVTTRSVGGPELCLKIMPPSRVRFMRKYS